MNGLCAIPLRCWETPPVVSATAFSGVLWLTARPDEALTPPLETTAAGVVADAPPPSAAYATAATSASTSNATIGSKRLSSRSALIELTKSLMG